MRASPCCRSGSRSRSRSIPRCLRLLWNSGCIHIIFTAFELRDFHGGFRGVRGALLAAPRAWWALATHQMTYRTVQIVLVDVFFKDQGRIARQQPCELPGHTCRTCGRTALLHADRGITVCAQRPCSAPARPRLGDPPTPLPPLQFHRWCSFSKPNRRGRKRREKGVVVKLARKDALRLFRSSAQVLCRCLQSPALLGPTPQAVVLPCASHRRLCTHHHGQSLPV